MHCRVFTVFYVTVTTNTCMEESNLDYKQTKNLKQLTYIP